MKKTVKTLCAAGFAFALTATSVFGQTEGLVFTIDEFGNGKASDGTVLQFTIGQDPSGGVSNAPVLMYNLPVAVLPGDVLLQEPATLGGTNLLSDVLRFWSPIGGLTNSLMIFYSDYSPNDPADAPADSGLPSEFIKPVTLDEVGPEGNNGAMYVPVPGQQPGADPGAVIPIQYHIISDVPEPNSVSLVALSGPLLLFALKRRIRLV